MWRTLLPQAVMSSDRQGVAVIPRLFFVDESSIMPKTPNRSRLARITGGPVSKRDGVRRETLKIDTLGEARIENPLPYCHFVRDDQELVINIPEEDLAEQVNEPVYYAFQQAGPRQKVYFDPSKTKCAIVTCGGLCPGINDVIRSIVMESFHNYGVSSCIGIRYGLQGFIPKYGHPVVELTPDYVSHIYEFGGTILGSSRGPQPIDGIVDALERMNVNILFLIGGDGSMRAAEAISAEAAKRKLKMSVIGVPKTIDNDINFVTRSFGFDTAVEKATEAIRSAHTEALGAFNGVGVVKLMGRESGFIAAQSTLALKEVNYVLVPEYRFELEGERGLLPALEKRLKNRRHAVIVVAEGAGQEHCEQSGAQDASGNVKLGDICDILIDRIKTHFKARKIPLTLKFIDPSYIIRSVPANANDRVYCGFLGQHVVHAAMSGKTHMVVGRVQDRYVHLPIEQVTAKRKKLNIYSDYWRSVLESTGQDPKTPIFNNGNHCERGKKKQK